MAGRSKADMAAMREKKAGRDPKPPRHLADMRAVYGNDEPERDTPAMRPLRVMKQDDFAGFLKQLNQYEKDFADEVRKRRLDYRAARKANAERRALGPAKGGVAKEGPDAGTMAAQALIEKLLREVE